MFHRIRFGGLCGVGALALACAVCGHALAAGDWDGDFIDTVGLYSLTTGAATLSAGHGDSVAYAFSYGPAGMGWMPISGDWDGDGTPTVGLYDPATSQFHLRNQHWSGPADIGFAYGPPGAGWYPVTGDWDGDGRDSVGLFDPVASRFHLTNAHAPAPAEHIFAYGPPGLGWVPIAGDWDGDGIDTVGLYDRASGIVHLHDRHEAGTGALIFAYGPSNSAWLPLAGDWDGDGAATIGLYDPGAGLFHVRNSHTSGIADLAFRFGTAAPDVVPVDSIPGRWAGSDAIAMLYHVNAARAQGYDCQTSGVFGPAPALTWNALLADAAARQSLDMAALDFFSHTGSDGSDVSSRVTDTGYEWWLVGENLAAGYATPAEATAALLSLIHI